MLNPAIFREYDTRGIADQELADEGVVSLGRALATYLIRHSGRTIRLGREGIVGRAKQVVGAV